MHSLKMPNLSSGTQPFFRFKTAEFSQRSHSPMSSRLALRSATTSSSVDPEPHVLPSLYSTGCPLPSLHPHCFCNAAELRDHGVSFAFCSVAIEELVNKPRSEEFDLLRWCKPTLFPSFSVPSFI
jgi:hypothetical protein